MHVVPVIPKYQQSLLEKGSGGNFSLVFTRGTKWRADDRGQLKAEFQSGTRRDRPKEPVFDSAIVQLGQRGTELLPQAATVLQKVHLLQQNVLQALQAQGGFTLEIRAKLTSPFVSGLGSGHPTETGMILDRNTGMPYIPASAIKGVLRLAHTVNILRSGQAGHYVRTGVVDNKGRFKPSPNGSQLDLDDREPSLRKYFGDTDTGVADGVRGQLVFLDAFPEAPPSLKADIMNPHFHKYYGENQPPVDCEDPIPVKFLSVAPGAVFVFRILAAPLARHGEAEAEPIDREFGPEDETRVLAMFHTAFEEVGFGGKTAVGYGRFIALSESPSVPVTTSGKPAAAPATRGPSTDPSAVDTPIMQPVQTEIWVDAFLSYLPNTGEISATLEGKKAMTKDKSLVPESITARLLGKKKQAKALVVVKPVGNAFAIIEIKSVGLHGEPG